MLQRRPCSADIGTTEKRGGAGTLGLLDEVAPHDVGSAIEDSIEVETMLIRCEETGIGLASGRGGAEKGPGHGTGEDEDGDPVSILAGSAGSIGIYALCICCAAEILVDWKQKTETWHAATFVPAFPEVGVRSRGATPRRD